MRNLLNIFKRKPTMEEEVTPTPEQPETPSEDNGSEQETEPAE